MVRVRFLLFGALCFFPGSVALQAQQFTITKQQLVSSVRVSLYQYDYTYQITASNTGSDAATAATCLVTSSTPQTIIRSGRLTFGDIPSGSAATGSTTLVLRQDRRYQFSWSNIRWQWSWRPAADSWTQNAGPEGGKLNYPNGVVLSIPAGALSDPTPIEVSELFVEEIDPIFQHYGLVGKYFAGGFEGKPNGLVFKSPITAVIPVLPPKHSGDVPILFAVDVVNHTYTPVSTTLHFDPASSTVSVQIEHFSSWAVAFGDDIYTAFDCKTNPNDCHCGSRSFTVAEDVQEGAVSSECNYVTVIGSVTFEQCSGGPVQQWSIRERNIPKIHILPEGGLQLEYDQTGPLDTTLIDSEGRRLSSQWINWSLDDITANLVSIRPLTGPTTWVAANEKPGIARVSATGGCGNSDSSQVNIRPRGTPQLDLKPSVANLCRDSLTMNASPKDTNGNEIPNVNIRWWPVTPANVAVLTPIANGYDALLKGITDAGDIVTVTAEADGFWGSNLFDVTSTPAQIRIGGLASFWISPANVKLSVGDLQKLRVKGRDYCGNSFEFIPVEWTIPSGGIIAFDPATRTIRAVAPGTATLSTQYQNQSASIQVTVVPSVYTVEVIPSDVILGTSVSKQFSAVLKDKDGNVVVGPTVHWSSNAPAIASVGPATGLVVSGNQDGTATITAEASGKTGSANVRVRLVTSVSISPAEAVVDVGGAVQFVATAKDADGDIILPNPDYISWRVSNPAVALLTMNYITATASANAVGNVTITVSVNGIEGHANLSVNKLGLYVKAKIGNCDWNALYCEFPAVLQPVQVTVMAGYRQADGNIKYQGGISIDARSSGSGGGLGVTDQNGVFQFSTQAIYKTSPSIRIWIIPNSDVDASIVAGAITRDFCSADSNGVKDISYPDECIGADSRCSGSFSFTYKRATGSAGVSVSSGGIAGVIKIGQWWDTLLVAPSDMTLLGQPLKVTFSVSASGSGSAYGGTGNYGSTQANWSASFNTVYSSGLYNPDAPPIETNQSEVTFSGFAFGHTLQPSAQYSVSARAEVRCYPSPTYPVDQTMICTPPASSSAQFQTSVNGITSVVNYFTGRPLNFRVFSCSGTQY